MKPRQLVPKLLDALEQINSTIYAKGAPLGTTGYFTIRKLACDALFLGGRFKSGACQPKHAIEDMADPEGDDWGDS